ncbi:hypothetical protein [Psychrobacillus sp. FSL K6-1267]|uniref:hypothetical protein n=1 Tax=Psychrobacillus sp. FSL K6-1267 TaxID=2921543 RepID=UPI0030F708BF
MTVIERSQQVLTHLLNSPQGDVYSLEVVDLQKVMSISQQELELVVKRLRILGHRINSICIKNYGLKRIQMNQGELIL